MPMANKNRRSPAISDSILISVPMKSWESPKRPTTKRIMEAANIFRQDITRKPDRKIEAEIRLIIHAVIISIFPISSNSQFV